MVTFSPPVAWVYHPSKVKPYLDAVGSEEIFPSSPVVLDWIAGVPPLALKVTVYVTGSSIQWA